MTTKLSVNLNAVAQLRNRRDLPWPSVVGIGRIALEAGAYGLTVHPRPDERHIRRSDVPELAALLRDFPDREYNIEGYPDDRFITLVEEIKPHQVTLVPDDPAQATSDHGWDFRANHNFLTPIVARLRDAGMRTVLFADADANTIPIAAEIGADRVELYTGPYGGCFDDPQSAERELEKLVGAAQAARAAGMGVNAGHDLTLENLPSLMQRIAFIDEVSIGHCVTADALLYGMADAVRRYRQACGEKI